jgi:hypothetical protein
MAKLVRQSEPSSRWRQICGVLNLVPALGRGNTRLLRQRIAALDAGDGSSSEQFPRQPRLAGRPVSSERSELLSLRF